MRGSSPSRVAFSVALLTLLLVPFGRSRAADEGVLSRSGDKLTTDIADAGDDDVFTLELLEGTTLNLSVKAGKKNGLLPAVSVFRPDGTRFDETLFAKKAGTKKPGLKKLPVESGDGGQWAIRIGTTDGEPGDYVISFKLKIPKKTKARGLPVAAGERVRVKFGARDGALVTVTVKEKDKKEGTPLAGVVLLDPTGREVTTAVFERKKAKLSLRKFPVQQGFGNYAVEVEGGAEGGNVVDVLVKVKFAKRKRRKEVLPPEASVEGISVDTVKQEDEGVTMTLTGANFLDGASARFETAGLPVRSVEVTGSDTATIVFDADEDAAFGEHDFTFVPPVLYGEAKSITRAIRVLAPDPSVTGAGNADVQQAALGHVVEVYGARFRPGGTVRVSGTGVTVVSTQVVRPDLARVTLDLDLTAQTGTRDVTFRQPDAGGGAEAVGVGLLTVQQLVTVQPRITSAIPDAIGRTGNGGPTRDVPVIITGTKFVDGATLSVVRAGGSGVFVVEGSESVESAARLAAVLRVEGSATTGAWDVIVTNPRMAGQLSDRVNNLIRIENETTLTVNRVLPGTGAAHGGDRVTIHGAGFEAGAVVDFGSQRGYGTQVIDRNTLVTTVPVPLATSLSDPTRVAVTVTNPGGASATHAEGFAYAADGVTYFTVVKVVPAQGATGVNRNLRSACVLLSAPIDPSSVSYGFTPASQVNWGESGGYGVPGGIHGFGPARRWLVFSRTSSGNLTIDNLGTYVLNLPTAMTSVGGANFVVNRVASSTYDQRTFTVSSTATDTTAPTLDSIVPAHGATNQVTTTGIVLVFSEAVDPRTLTASNVTLLDGTTPVGAAVLVDDDLRTVRLVPHTELTASRTFTVRVGSGVADLCGNSIATLSRTFTTHDGNDTTAPTVDRVAVESIPASLDGSATYVAPGGSSGNGFDLFLPVDGFRIRVEFSDHGGAGIDTSKFSAKCSRTVGAIPSNAELRSWFTVTQTFAEWRIPATHPVGAFDDVTFRFTVTDLAGNASAEHQIRVDVLGRTANTAGSGTGDLDPFPTRYSVVLRFDLDRYGHAYTTQSNPARQGVTTTSGGNGANDFEESLRIVGLVTPNMTSAAANTTNGFDTGTNDILLRMVQERIREILRMRFGIDEDGTHGADSVDIEFLLTGEQGSLPSLPTLSTSASASNTNGHSELSFGGTGGAESNAFTAGTTNGGGHYDARNATWQANINTDGTVGIFASTMLKREVNGFPSRPFFQSISAKFVPIHGGTRVGEHASDDNVLAGSFDRSTSSNTTHNQRYDDIMDAVELVALYLSATAAHEIGHSAGVVADGAPKTGQFGAAHENNTFTDATSANPNTSGHLSLAGMNNLMATGSNFSLMSRTGTEFQRFAPHVMGYLLRRVIYDEGR